MAGKKQTLLTADDVKGWLQERHDLQRKIATQQKKLEDLNQKLAAAELLSPGSTNRKIDGHLNGAPTDERAPNEEMSPPESKDGTDASLAEILYADLLKSGAALGVAQIKDRLVQIGLGPKLEQASPNYVHGLVFRLTKAGRLLRRANSYRAVPPASSQEEAGAKAPAPSASSQV
jgi:hypothetical protein